MQILICKYDNLKLEYKELKILIKYVVNSGDIQNILICCIIVQGEGDVIYYCGIKYCCNFFFGFV